MLKSVLAKVFFKRKHVRSCYSSKKLKKYPVRVRWNIIRASFYILVLFYKTKNKRQSSDKKSCAIVLNKKSHFFYISVFVAAYLNDEECQ